MPSGYPACQYSPWKLSSHTHLTDHSYCVFYLEMCIFYSFSLIYYLVVFTANFILQFLVLSLLVGVPLFTFHSSLGQLLGAGVMDMWRISPIFKASSPSIPRIIIIFIWHICYRQSWASYSILVIELSYKLQEK